MRHEPDQQPQTKLTVPLFPLPNVVLFPRAVLPLHIFEERYKTMTAHALAENRQVAMALLQPGWEKDYYQKPAIDPVVCIGKILTSERLPDGKYNFLLQGQTRARIIREIPGQPYRVGELELIPQTHVLEIDLSNERQRLIEMFSSGGLAGTPAGQQINQILASPLPTSDVVDLIAYNLLEDVALKQSLLADGDVIRRVSRVIAALDQTFPMIQASTRTEDGRSSLN